MEKRIFNDSTTSDEDLDTISGDGEVARNDYFEMMRKFTRKE